MTGDLSPEQRLLRLLAGKWVVSALAAAAELGVCDRLAETGAQTSEQLAQTLECHAPSLDRLLGVLAGEGLLRRTLDGAFEVTDMGLQLRRGALGELARFVGSRSQWTPWASLAETVRTGEAAFAREHGLELFEYLSAHPDESELYDQAVDAFTGHTARALAERFDFDEVDTVVDVGGGRGTVLVELLTRWPHLKGVLVDLPHVVSEAAPRLRDELGDRCDTWAGDFFEAVPEGADCYVIKHVLHNWDDDRAGRLLDNCRGAMAPGGRVLVIDGVLLPGDRRDPTRLLDLEMMVLTGSGRERTKPELRKLMADAGLRLVMSCALTDGARLMVAVPTGR